MERLTQYDAYDIECSRILCDSDYNCRGAFDLHSVSQLADDIAARGLETPIEVQPALDIEGGLDGFDFRVNTGHRRFVAVTTFLKWETIPAIIKAGLSPLRARINNLLENSLRENLNPLQEAFALQKIIALYPPGTSSQRIFTDLKKTRRWLNDRKALLTLPEQVHGYFASGQLAMHEVEVILRGSTTEERVALAEEVIRAKRDRTYKVVPRDLKLERTFRRVRGKQEINALISQMLKLEIEKKVSAARVAAWCAGTVSDAEIQEEFSLILESKQHG